MLLIRVFTLKRSLQKLKPTSKPARPATQPAEAASTVSQRSQTAQPASQPEPSQATLTRQAWEACSADSIFYRSKRRCYFLDTNDVLLHENKLFLLLCRNMHGAEARTRFLKAPGPKSRISRK